MSSDKQILVYVARHGTTDLNKQNAYRGPIDAPLDKSGTRDANQLAFYFEPIDLSYIFHSDKKRTRATADMVGQRKHMETISKHNLRAWDVGDLGGKPKDEENEAIIDFHVENPEIELPGGESLNEFKARVRPLIVEAIEIACNCGTPVLLVAHSSVVHEVGTMIGGSDDYTLVEPGGVCAIYVENGELDAEPIFKPRPRERGPEVT